MKNFIALSLTTLCLLASCKDSEKTKSIEEKNSYEDVTKTEDLVSENTHKIVVTEKMSSGGQYKILNRILN